MAHSPEPSIESSISRKPFLVAVVALTAALLAGLSWALASPLSASPDDNQHLGSPWCIGEYDEACQLVGPWEYGPERDEVIIPALEGYSMCFQGDPNQSGACQKEPGAFSLFTANSSAYPRGFYSLMGLFAGDNAEVSAVTMRMVSFVLSAMMLGVGAFLLIGNQKYRILLIWVAIAVPTGWFFFSSNNPSGVAIAAASACFPAAIAGLQHRSRGWLVASWSAVAVFTTIAMNTRNDGLMYSMLSVGLAVLVAIGLGSSVRGRSLKFWALGVGALVLVGLAFLGLASRYSLAEGVGRAFGEALENPALFLDLVAKIPWAFGYYFGTAADRVDVYHPELVSAARVLVLGMALAVALNRASRRRGAGVLILVTLMFSIPLAWNAAGGFTLQPRYFFSLTMVLAALLLVDLKGSRPVLSRSQSFTIADSVTAKPWRHAIAATGILLLLALPMTQMSFGQTDASALPKDTTAYQANELISDAFGPGRNGPLAVVVQLNKPAEAPEDTSGIPSGTDPRSYDPRLLSLEDDLRETAGVDQVGDAVVSADAGVAVISVIPTTSPADPATQELVDELRTTVLPAATNGQDEEAYVGGSTALMMDLSDEIAAALPIFIGGVVLLSGSLLLLAYRSLVIPIKAAAMNLLSICAAYGVVVAVFQFGWGASLLGLDELVPIESYVPMMMFAVLFGLSMDYEVFLLTSFREHWTRTGDMVASVRRGLADTGEVVTAAASIMVVVFAAFILVPGAVVKMFGVGLATAVLVDATIVRCVLVPALMVLAAKATWWLPKWLDRSLPELHVEGDPASLETIHEPLPDDRPSTVAEATAPTVGLVWAAIAGLVSWWICTNTLEAGTNDPFLPLAVTISAIVGALVVWLPRGVPGSGRGPAVRVVMLVLGGGFVAAVFGLLAALIPFTERNQGMMAAWGLVLLALFAAYTPARKYGLPLILGGIVTGVALALVDLTTIGQGNVLQVTVLPLLLSGFLAITLNRLARTLPSPPDDDSDAGDPPAPSAPAEKVGASS